MLCDNSLNYDMIPFIPLQGKCLLLPRTFLMINYLCMCTLINGYVPFIHDSGDAFAPSAFKQQRINTYNYKLLHFIVNVNCYINWTISEGRICLLLFGFPGIELKIAWRSLSGKISRIHKLALVTGYWHRQVKIVDPTRDKICRSFKANHKHC